MQRLRCGVILLDGFIDHLRELSAMRYDGMLPAIDYVKCIDLRSGESWWSLTWTTENAVQAHNLFDLGGLQIYLSLQTQKALKHHYIDFRDGDVFVG